MSLPSRESFDSLSDNRNCSCSLSKRPIWNSSSSILTVVSFVSQFSSSILTEFDSSEPQSPSPKLTMGSILATCEDIRGLTILRSVPTCRRHSQRSLTSTFSSLLFWSKPMKGFSSGGTHIACHPFNAALSVLSSISGNSRPTQEIPKIVKFSSTGWPDYFWGSFCKSSFTKVIRS